MVIRLCYNDRHKTKVESNTVRIHNDCKIKSWECKKDFSTLYKQSVYEYKEGGEDWILIHVRTYVGFKNDFADSEILVTLK